MKRIEKLRNRKWVAEALSPPLCCQLARRQAGQPLRNGNTGRLCLVDPLKQVSRLAGSLEHRNEERGNEDQTHGRREKKRNQEGRVASRVVSLHPLVQRPDRNRED